MKQGSRNFVVGLFVVLGAVIIAWMARNFKGGPALSFLRGGYQLKIEFDSLAGVAEGSEVRLNGKRIGMVTATTVDPSAERPGTVIAEIQAGVRLPATVRGELVAEMFGRRYIDLTYVQPPRSEADYLPSDGATMLKIPGAAAPGGLDQVAKQVAGSVSVLEAEMKTALREATAVMANMNKLIDKNSEAVEKTLTGISVMLGSKQNQENLARALDFFGGAKLHEDIGKSVEGIRGLAADPKVQEDVRGAIADIRAVSAEFREMSVRLKETTAKVDAILSNADKQIGEIGGSAKNISKSLEEVTRELPAQMKEVTAKVNGDLERVAVILQSLQTVARKVESGDGTVGKLMNDAKLYESMVELVKSLQLIGEDMRKLVKKWDEGGIKFRL